MDTQPSLLPNPFTPQQPQPQEPKHTSSQTLLLLITTVVVAISVPITVLVVQQRNDIRGRAAEPKETQPIIIASPLPRFSACAQNCTQHADCSPGFFCTEGACKNALCPTAIDCVCQKK